MAKIKLSKETRWLVESLKKQDKACGLLIDAQQRKHLWTSETQTTAKIALDLAIRTIDLLHKQVNKELGFKE